MRTPTSSAPARVTGVNGNIVSIASPDIPLVKNEVVHILHGEERLKAEVLRIRGETAEVQVFEDTLGVRVGELVELTGRLLSVALGPGLLGTVYDGLQNPLEKLAELDGFFLKRGREVPALDPKRTWPFTPAVRVGDRVRAGDVLGTVPENRFAHKIMAPFGDRGGLEILSIREGEFTVEEPIARVRDVLGRERSLTLQQPWPVRKPLPEVMSRLGLVTRNYPETLLRTQLRLIDTFFPIPEGGTACIPGPFGAGKTVLQGLIARHSSADITIVVACGERASEVAETIETFTRMPDPRGGSLIDRTIIIANTSSMPVAARESSIYTGITLGEYYRQMGHAVLLIADSTSRWAQAMRETSGRLEEIPGDEAYPAYLDSAIKGAYERAGVVTTRDGGAGSLTMIGTVSPAGGNFEEPVTQATLGTVKTFLGLSYERAYKRFYPAVDPLLSWSRYGEQLRPYFENHVQPGWPDLVARLTALLREGESVRQMMQVTGEEGVTPDDFLVERKAAFVDMVYLQQDAFDPVDVAVPMDRQRLMFNLVCRCVDRPYHFPDKEQARDFFTRLTGAFKNLNYSEGDSDAFGHYLAEIERLLDEAT